MSRWHSVNVVHARAWFSFSRFERARVGHSRAISHHISSFSTARRENYSKYFVTLCSQPRNALKNPRSKTTVANNVATWNRDCETLPKNWIQNWNENLIRRCVAHNQNYTRQWHFTKKRLPARWSSWIRAAWLVKSFCMCTFNKTFSNRDEPDRITKLGTEAFATMK